MWAVALVACGIAGFLIGWLLAAARVRTESEREIREGAVRAGRAETAAEAARKEKDAAKTELDEVRGKLTEAQTERTALRTSLVEAERRLEEERKLLAVAEEKLTKAFESVASRVLKSNTETFLTLASDKLESAQKEAVKDLEARQKSIELVVKPVAESIEKMDHQIADIEKEREGAYREITQQVESLAKTQDALRSETANLVKALRSPAVRGRWGEMQLRRVVELAGMVECCDFSEQKTHDTDAGRLRPDLIVKLPGGKSIVVDAKVPLMAYLEALEAPTEELRVAKLKEHARQVRDHMGQLSSKAYWEHLQPTPEFVFLFLPGESFFSAALEQDPSLIEHGANQRVILATPTTLIALLKAVAYGWRQEQLAENAQRISALGQQLYDRLAKVVGHVAHLGSSIGSSVEAFNETVGSLQSRLVPVARRFKELGVVGQQELRELEPVVTVPRLVSEPIDEPAAAVQEEESL